MIEISIVLPTLNEGENLQLLVPDIQKELKKIEINSFEIIIVDDGSEDNSKIIVEDLSNTYGNVRFIDRTGEKSLPLSILEGIKNSNFPYVMWLDADGSMPADTVKKLIIEQVKSPGSVIIGSRFVEGGGYKGIKKGEETSFFKAINNVYNSEDSILAVFLSKIFNQLLNRILRIGVKDLTSGFIIGKKEYFDEEAFIGASYGDYFIKLMLILKSKSITCKEIPYFCETRIFGESKTGSNYIQLFKRGLPYLKLAFKLKK